MKQRKNYFGMAVIAVIIVCAVFGFTIYQFYKQSRMVTNRLIAEHITELAAVFKKIDEECNILHILHDRSYIDFLNVRSFSGSEVGSLNLVHPEKWKGPYLQDNPTIQGKLFEIIKTSSGYYIVPGTGVQLTNGKVIGKDIVFTAKTNISSLSCKKFGLEYQGKPLVAQLLPLKHTVAPDLLMTSELYDSEAS
jgi:hypothetical protein